MRNYTTYAQEYVLGLYTPLFKERELATFIILLHTIEIHGTWCNKKQFVEC